MRLVSLTFFRLCILLDRPKSKRVTRGPRMYALLFALGTMVCLVSGCATLPPELTSKLDNAAIPKHIELDDVPFFPQERYQCGPAALATVMSHAGKPTDPQTIGEHVYVPKREGSFQVELIAFARSKSLLVYTLEPVLIDLLTEVASGHSVLILQNLGFAWAPQWHYAVVVGYDLANETITLRSGTTRRLDMPLASFFATWHRAKSWAVVVVPSSDIPKTAVPKRFLRAAHALEVNGDIASARRAYDASTARWPDDASTWFLAGNAAFSQGALDTADYALRRATDLAPHTAIFWNNLAHVAAVRGCKSTALAAAQCASRLAPNDPTVRVTLTSLQSQSHQFVMEASCAELDCPR